MVKGQLRPFVTNATKHQFFDVTFNGLFSLSKYAFALTKKKFWDISHYVPQPFQMGKTQKWMHQMMAISFSSHFLFSLQNECNNLGRNDDAVCWNGSTCVKKQWNCNLCERTWFLLKKPHHSNIFLPFLQKGFSIF